MKVSILGGNTHLGGSSGGSSDTNISEAFSIHEVPEEWEVLGTASPSELLIPVISRESVLLASGRGFSLKKENIISNIINLYNFGTLKIY